MLTGHNKESMSKYNGGSDDFPGKPVLSISFRAMPTAPGWMLYIFLFSLGALLCLFACDDSLSAQSRFTPCAPADKFIEIKVTPKTIAPTVSAPERHVWVLAEVPTGDQVQPAPGDAAVKNVVLEVLQEIRDSGVQVGGGEEGTPQPAVPQLVILLAGLQEVRPDLKVKVPPELGVLPQPSDQGQMYTVRLCLDYTIPSCRPGTVEINITTLAGRTAALAV